jgi:MFS family permease
VTADPTLSAVALPTPAAAARGERERPDNPLLGLIALGHHDYLEVLKGVPRMVLALFLGSGAVGTLVAGAIADRVGVRRYVVKRWPISSRTVSRRF